MNDQTIPKLTRRELNELPRKMIHQARNWTKADVFTVEWPPQLGQHVVVKDLRQRPFWYRVLVGRHLLKREACVLEALSDVQGVPNLITQPDADAIVMSYFPGCKLDKLGKRMLPASAIHEIENLITLAHERGVTHGDLHTTNILISADGAVAIIDWATGCLHHKRLPLWRRRLLWECRALDLRALAKIKLRYNALKITSGERDLLFKQGSTIYMLFKQVRYIIQWLRPYGRPVRRNKTHRKITTQLKKLEEQKKQQASDL